MVVGGWEWVLDRFLEGFLTVFCRLLVVSGVLYSVVEDREWEVDIHHSFMTHFPT